MFSEPLVKFNSDKTFLLRKSKQPQHLIPEKFSFFIKYVCAKFFKTNLFQRALSRYKHFFSSCSSIFSYQLKMCLDFGIYYFNPLLRNVVKWSDTF